MPILAALIDAGDLGYIGAGGNLFFSGRLSDVIKTGGENVNAFEVEDLLRVFEAPQGSSLAGLRLCAAAVVGLPDLRLGEQVCAVVTVSPEDFRRVAERQGVSGDPEFLHDSELHRLLRNHLRSGGLAGFKHPKTLYICLKLPRNSSGKVVKQRLKKRVESFRKIAGRRRMRSKL
uniref:AMP-binding enzyme C-terminal domain-containing protein n=1 Tax=Pinguiococcus pyrenoidosus TaxID=172671 RepID=A0A7R9YBL9_9STRA|mmetsp:Transcript_17378/g.66190  ORF Transcript_17378/g.66190 Transcript_17378/m.66190 type:complete len:175 (+) Transcript_17378:63-587(+)